MERSPSSARTCFACARRERGQKRVPLPPARITGRKSIALGMENSSYPTEGVFAQSRQRNQAHSANLATGMRSNWVAPTHPDLGPGTRTLDETGQKLTHATGSFVDVFLRHWIGQA